jgi:predicted trehalose synthase
MEASAIAAMASSNALAQVQQEASVEVLRKALDIQGESAMQLLQAIPRPPAPAVGSTAGGIVDTYA